MRSSTLGIVLRRKNNTGRKDIIQIGYIEEPFWAYNKKNHFGYTWEKLFWVHRRPIPARQGKNYFGYTGGSHSGYTGKELLSVHTTEKNYFGNTRHPLWVYIKSYFGYTWGDPLWVNRERTILGTQHETHFGYIWKDQHWLLKGRRTLGKR